LSIRSWSDYRFIFHRTFFIGPQTGCLYRLGPVDGDSCQATVSLCFGTLRQLYSIRLQVPTAVFHSLIVALVLSRLDYCNSVQVGLPANLIWRLQSVQNAASRLIFGIRRSKHIKDTLTRGIATGAYRVYIPSQNQSKLTFYGVKMTSIAPQDGIPAEKEGWSCAPPPRFSPLVDQLSAVHSPTNFVGEVHATLMAASSTH